MGIMKSIKGNGASILELVIAMAILFICVFFFMPTFMDTLKTYSASTERTARIRDASNCLQQISNDLRISKMNIKSPSPFPTNTPVVPDTGNPVIIQMYYNDFNTEDIEYTLSNNKVFRKVTRESQISTRQIADNINSLRFYLYKPPDFTNPLYMKINVELKLTDSDTKYFNLEDRVFYQD